MKGERIKNILTPDLVQQLVNLRNQGKSVSQMARITGLPLTKIRYIGTILLQKGFWTYSPTWKKRQKTINQMTPTKSNKVGALKMEKKTRKKREIKSPEHIIINFKGVNLQVQKTSNIIITDTIIYVK